MITSDGDAEVIMQPDVILTSVLNPASPYTPTTTQCFHPDGSNDKVSV
jgi:hypothetical protein